jgi:hypothetical protein
MCRDRAGDAGRLLECLREHPHELSEQCAGGIAVHTTRTWAWRRKCRTDVARHCPTTPPGEDAALRCLIAYVDGLSASCRQRLEKLEDWSERFRSGAERWKRKTGIVPLSCKRFAPAAFSRKRSGFAYRGRFAMSERSTLRVKLRSPRGNQTFLTLSSRGQKRS